MDVFIQLWTAIMAVLAFFGIEFSAWGL